MTMKNKAILILTITVFFLTPVISPAQRIEIGVYAGGQINGGVDLSTTLFDRIEVQNGVNYGLTVGYLLGDHLGAEFQWNRNDTGTTAQPIGGGDSIKVFNLTQNNYMGNFLFHMSGTEAKLRPFVLIGFGANALSTDASGVDGSTRFTYAVGAGAKYNTSRHLGLRGQFRYAPTYLTTTSNGGYWCDPFWGGCWVEGQAHYLNEVDFTGGVTLRF